MSFTAPAIAPVVEAAPLVAAPWSHAAVAAPLHAPIAHSSYSVSTQHVAAPALHYAAAPLAAPLAVAHSAPVAYATKTIHGSPYVQQYATHW